MRNNTLMTIKFDLCDISYIGDKIHRMRCTDLSLEVLSLAVDSVIRRSLDSEDDNVYQNNIHNLLDIRQLIQIASEDVDPNYIYSAFMEYGRFVKSIVEEALINYYGFALDYHISNFTHSFIIMYKYGIISVVIKEYGFE